METASKFALGLPPSSEIKSSTTYAAAAPQSRHVPDAYAPPVFNGLQPDPESWLAHMRRYASYRQMDETDQLAAFPLYLKDGAIDWYDTLGQDVRNNMEQLLKEFQSFFCPSPIDHVLQAESVFTRVQRPSERVYVTTSRPFRNSRDAFRHLTKEFSNVSYSGVCARTLKLSCCNNGLILSPKSWKQ